MPAGEPIWDAADERDLERRLLAAALGALADWLRDESARLAADEAPDRGKVRVLFPTDAAAAALTARERQIAGCIARGLSNRQIADSLVIASSTSERHVANILAKLGMRSRAQVAAWAVEHRLA